MLRVVRFTKCTPKRRSSSDTRLLSFDVATPSAREAAEYPPCSITFANKYMSFRSCISSIFAPHRCRLKGSLPPKVHGLVPPISIHSLQKGRRGPTGGHVHRFLVLDGRRPRSIAQRGSTRRSADVQQVGDTGARLGVSGRAAAGSPTRE